ncbi:MAG: cyclic nucleotide-binding domain-containing protein [Thermodesulfobacteriota bacterium]|nr:cyclic nucleotide-binding domain-containing protein [Thermodesulfobacteriota bacterium]
MTDTKDKLSRLADTDVFKSMPEEQLGKIATVLKEETVPAKTVLFRKGDSGYSFYIIHSGRIRVFLTGEDGVETDLNILGPGDSFGEMALITDDPRSTNVEALEETHLFVLAKEEFQGILKDHPEIFKNVFKYMSDLIKRDDRRLQKKTEREYRATKLSFFDFVFIGIVILLFASIFNLSNPNKINVIPDFYDPEEISKVDLEYAKKKFDEGETIFIDARPANFYEKLHIKGARNLPLPSFEINYMYMPDEEKKKDMIVYGRSIGALYDEEVARQLQLLGHDNVQIYKGPHQYLPLKWFALDAWQESKYPVEGAGHE